MKYVMKFIDYEKGFKELENQEKVQGLIDKFHLLPFDNKNLSFVINEYLGIQKNIEIKDIEDVLSVELKGIEKDEFLLVVKLNDNFKRKKFHYELIEEKTLTLTFCC